MTETALLAVIYGGLAALFALTAILLWHTWPNLGLHTPKRKDVPMTLNLKPGDYARDADGNVYGPLKWDGSFFWVEDSGDYWRPDGSQIHEALPRLVAKVRPVTTYEDVPPEPEAVRVRIAIERVQKASGKWATATATGTISTDDHTPDWSTLRVTA